MVEGAHKKQMCWRFMEVIMWSHSAYVSFVFSGPHYEITKVDCGPECLPFLFFIFLVQRKQNLSVDIWHDK